MKFTYDLYVPRIPVGWQRIETTTNANELLETAQHHPVWKISCTDNLNHTVFNWTTTDEVEDHLVMLERRVWKDAAAPAEVQKLKQLCDSKDECAKAKVSMISNDNSNREYPSDTSKDLEAKKMITDQEARLAKQEGMSTIKATRLYTKQALSSILANNPEFNSTVKSEVKTNPIDKAVRPDHYKGFVDDLQWLDVMSRIPSMRNPDNFKAALELQVRKYLDRLGRKDTALQELKKAAFYLQYWIAYIENDNKPIIIEQTPSLKA